MGHHSTTTRVQKHIGDPTEGLVKEVSYEVMEEIFQDIQSDMRFDHELNGCPQLRDFVRPRALRPIITTFPREKLCNCYGRKILKVSMMPCKKKSGRALSVIPVRPVAHLVIRLVA